MKIKRETLAKKLLRVIHLCPKNINTIAKESGVPQPVLYRWVNGHRDDITLNTAEKLALYFNLELTERK